MKTYIWLGLIGIAAASMAWFAYEKEPESIFVMQASVAATPHEDNAAGSASAQSRYIDAGFYEAEAGLSPSA